MPEGCWHFVIKDSRGTAEGVELYKNRLTAMLVHKKKAVWWHALVCLGVNHLIHSLAFRGLKSCIGRKQLVEDLPVPRSCYSCPP
ncbi:hypothetical protein IG631_23856 [Alternaria alternata]|nr:hypothetical protein IG631_23856 [Alternaria alternata]